MSVSGPLPGASGSPPQTHGTEACARCHVAGTPRAVADPEPAPAQKKPAGFGSDPWLGAGPWKVTLNGSYNYKEQLKL